jgi:hypothetical protein
MGIQGHPSPRIVNAVGGRSSGIQYGHWTPDWNDLESVDKAAGVYKRLATAQQAYASGIDPAQDYLLGPNSIPSWRDSTQGIANPYHSQGLGPANYSGKYISDVAGDQARWYEASHRKFELRSQELKGIASAPAAGGFGAGTQEAYDAQQTAREGLSRPFAEGARAAELLRQTSGPARRGGGGGGAAPQGRQASRAGAAERRRMASSDRTSGGSGGGGLARRRLRASSLTGTPLGAGSQSAAQLLG